jgi:hypothetical protein
MTEYEIQPLSLSCAQTGRPLKPGETYYSVLTDSSNGLTRLDFSAESWNGPPEGAIGYWRSRVPHREDKNRPQPVDDSVLVHFFKRLSGDREPARENFRYILALLLLRKKLLKLTGAAEEQGREVLFLRETATGEEHRVINPSLTEEQLIAVQMEAEKILQSPME